MNAVVLESRDFGEAIVETIREPLLILDDELRVRAANPAFHRAFALDSTETLGTRLYELGDRAWDVPDLRRLLEDVVPQDREVVDYRVEHEFADLGHRVLLVNARQVRFRGDETGAILLAVEDVTEREETRDALERYARDLERSNQELEQFAYVASHDLQEPLRMVTSYLRLIERRYRERLDDDGIEFIDFAVDGAERMRRLINDLLAFSRAGRRKLELEAVELDRAVRTAMENLAVQARKVDARLETAGDLPVVRADRDAVIRVLQNLFSNAIKYRRDEAAPIVRVSAAADGVGWRVAVEDEGIGIPEEQRERVFEIFRQLKVKPDEDGTGIGLAICRRLVEAMGGRMWAEEAPSGGARICFTLAAAPEAASSSPGSGRTEEER